MEDSFRVRVDKAFGSLASSSSTSTTLSLSSSLWCLTDEEIERNKWNRDKDDGSPEPYPFNRPEMEDDLQELEDDVDNDESGGKPKPDYYNDEEWDIKNSIGLDCTLDYEEEDGYDKVAVGMENAGDRLYMSNVNDYGKNIDSCRVLPDSIVHANKDPRANHMAAKIRLQEDAEAAKKMDTLRVTDKDSPATAHAQAKPFGDANPKSILKRKGDQLVSISQDNRLDSKPQKRVRFNPECRDGYEESEVKDKGTDFTEGKNACSLPSDYSSGVPDYMRNPSKYTRYTFDSSSDVDEASNRKAYMDFLNMLKRSNTTESHADDALFDLPKSVAFIPKKKTSDVTTTSNCTESKQNRGDNGEESILRKGLPVRITAGDADDSDGGGRARNSF